LGDSNGIIEETSQEAMMSIETNAPYSEDEMHLNTYVDTVEAIISTLGENPQRDTKIQRPQHVWKFKYGTVDVFVYLTGESAEDTLMVWSPVLTLPAKDEAELHKFLLEKNWLDTLEARFAVKGEQIVLTCSRTLQDLDPGEVSRAITIVATLADDYDEVLIEKFK
jgi:Putative bacterial sensory transduction regulator